MDRCGLCQHKRTSTSIERLPMSVSADPVPSATLPDGIAARTSRSAKGLRLRRHRGGRPGRGERRIRPRPVHRDHGPVRLRASRRCMHCLAGLDDATSGQVFIGDAELTTLERQAADAICAGTGSASSSSRSTWCRRSPRWRTSRCRWTSPAASPTRHWLDTRRSTPSAWRDRLEHRPSQLSGGQQQRVAVRPGAGQPARDHLRRRAHRQPRLGGRRRGARLPARARSTSSARPS